MQATPKTKKPQAHAAGIAGNMARIAQAASAGLRPCSDVGQALGAARRACGLSQKHVAEHMQVSVRTVKRWEKGRCLPALPRQLYLCSYLEIPFTDVLQLKVKCAASPLSAIMVDKFTDLHV